VKVGLSILFAVSLCFAAETWVKGVVQDVHDGDTFKMKVDGQIIDIRIYGIDAPEEKQPYGKEAGEALRNLIDGKEIRLRMNGRRTWNRKVGEPWLGDSLNVSLWMVKNGHSWWYKDYSKKCMDLKEAEEEAKVKKLGLWASDDPVPPWDFRHPKKKAKGGGKEKKAGKRKGKRAGKR
jgi:endonuclease YncB( thermonuclease family)